LYRTITKMDVIDGTECIETKENQFITIKRLHNRYLNQIVKHYDHDDAKSLLSLL
jgi:hypothetical protein